MIKWLFGAIVGRFCWRIRGCQWETRRRVLYRNAPRLHLYFMPRGETAGRIREDVFQVCKTCGTERKLKL